VAGGTCSAGFVVRAVVPRFPTAWPGNRSSAIAFEKLVVNDQQRSVPSFTKRGAPAGRFARWRVTQSRPGGGPSPPSSQRAARAGRRAPRSRPGQTPGGVGGTHTSDVRAGTGSRTPPLLPGAGVGQRSRGGGLRNRPRSARWGTQIVPCPVSSEALPFDTEAIKHNSDQRPGVPDTTSAGRQQHTVPHARNPRRGGPTPPAATALPRRAGHGPSKAAGRPNRRARGGANERPGRWSFPQRSAVN